MAKINFNCINLREWIYFANGEFCGYELSRSRDILSTFLHFHIANFYHFSIFLIIISRVTSKLRFRGINFREWQKNTHPAYVLDTLKTKNFGQLKFRTSVCPKFRRLITQARIPMVGKGYQKSASHV